MIDNSCINSYATDTATKQSAISPPSDLPFATFFWANYNAGKLDHSLYYEIHTFSLYD